MKNRNLYTAIAATTLLCNLYGLFWIIKIAIKPGFQFENNLSLFFQNVPTYMAIAGSILFLTSRFRRSSLLRIYMCFTIINHPLWMFVYYYFTSHASVYSEASPYGFLFYVSMGTALLEFVASCLGLWLFTKDRVLKIGYNHDYDEPVAQFFNASKSKRFANRIIDVIVIVWVLVNNFLNNFYFETSNLHGYVRSENGVLLAEILSAMLFYIVLEGIYKTTPGKCATNTTIVDENGKTINFGLAVGRTLSRLIPFEPFSFLGASDRGWHDTISNTYVAETTYIADAATMEKSEEQSEPAYLNEFHGVQQQ